MIERTPAERAALGAVAEIAAVAVVAAAVALAMGLQLAPASAQSLLAGAAPSPSPGSAPQEIRLLCATGPCRVGESSPAPERGGEIVVENLDSLGTVTPYLAREGWPDLRSDRAILASILRDGMSPEAQALAIWNFVRAWRFGCTPFSQESQLLHDPVKLVNVFGCGLCDDSNSAVASLARLAGMPARIWGLGGHVVAEIAWDDTWHLLDAADGVYFRDKSQAIVGVETLAAHPELIASATNRALRQDAVVRTAELIDRGAGPTPGGRQSVAARQFTTVFRHFLEQRGKPSSAPLGGFESDLFDGVLSARYAALVTSTADNSVSDWWELSASGHEMALPLHPHDRVTYALRPASERPMSCYLNAERCLTASGTLERAALAPLAELDPGGDRAIVTERLPYVVEALSLDGRAMPPEAVLEVFVAEDGETFRPLGTLGARAIPGAPPAAEAPDLARSRLDLDLLPPGSQVEPRFGYRLKFVRRGHATTDLLRGVLLISRFKVAAKTLPWPEPGEAAVLVRTEWSEVPTPTTGLEVRFRRLD